MLKEEILSKSLIAKTLDEDELKSLLNTACTDLADAADLETAAAEYVEQSYMIKGIHYRCEEISAGVFEWVTYDTSGQNLNYADASNKPTLDGITLNGALTKSDLGIAPDTAARTTAADPTGMNILLDDDKRIVYDDLLALLEADFGIATLPKYEKQNNPLFTSDGTTATWTITHTCKTSEPIVQVYSSAGILQSTATLTNFKIDESTGTAKQVKVSWDTASSVTANSYYVVLIG
jgi:hypothetical protein